MNIDERQKRAAVINKLIKAIGGCGRRFFFSKRFDRYARIEVDQRGRVWFIDDYTEKRIYTHYHYWKRGFSHGGTMKDLVNAFRDYITKGVHVPAGMLGPWPHWLAYGDLWGYGDNAMQEVRDAALSHGVISP